MSEQQPAPFHDPQAVAAYAEGPARNVPGWADMLRMADLLLAERAPEDGTILVVGAGGGLELKRFAGAHPAWRFVGVDPSGEMLKLARATLGPLASRVDLHEGYVDSAPAGPFDGATCLLTMHFVAFEERQRMLEQIRRRLRPKAPLVRPSQFSPGGRRTRNVASALRGLRCLVGHRACQGPGWGAGRRVQAAGPLARTG